MKQFIHKSALLLSLLTATCLATKAQCLCAQGETPTAIEHLVLLDTTATSSTILTFPKFDPSIGTLSCVTLHDTISIVSTLGIRNIDPDEKTYRFRLTITTALYGATIASPAMSRDNFFDQVYGPNLLGAGGSPTDSITYGPDTLYDNFPSYTVNTSNLVPFMGLGNVQFEYEIGGGVASLGGGINFNSSVRTKTWGAFKLTYYWCPQGALASAIKNFSAVKKDNLVKLGWQVDNEEKAGNYEILVSTDGRKFVTAGRVANGQANDGNSTLYNYQYALSQSGGKLYFRIKQTDASGKAKFSAIRTVSLTENNNGSFGIYPNPVVRNVSLQFDRELKGNYKIELVNLLGQAIYNRTMQLNNQSQIQLQLNNPPAAGIYYVRVKSTETNQMFTNKLVIQR